MSTVITAGLDKEKHRAILNAAKEVFLSEGYTAASMDIIAKRAKVSKQTVYAHFKNKETLFKAFVDDMSQKTVFPFFLAAYELASPQECLTSFGCSYQEVVYKDEALKLYRLAAGEAMRKPEMAALFYDAGPRMIRTAMAGYLSKLVEKGWLAIDDLDYAAGQLCETMKGPRFMKAIFFAGTTPTEEEMQQHAERVINDFLKIYGTAKMPVSAPGQ